MPGNFDAAYGRFSSRFRGRVAKPEFDARMKYVQHNEVWGGLKKFNWNGLIAFEESEGNQYAVAPIQFEVEKSNPERPLLDNVTFRKEGDQWEIDNFPLLFPPAPPQGQRRQ